MSKSETDEEIKKVTEEFKEMVVNWVKIDDQIRDLKASVKELTDEKKQYEEFIIEYMSNAQENIINISDGKLRLNKSTTKAPLKEENITI